MITPVADIPIGLSTASVYPQNTEAAFAYAAELGFDGVELMVWGEAVSQDISHVEYLSERYQVPVLSIHAPCLLISQRVWGRDPQAKLARAVSAAEDLGAPTVVVHPPFRWQRAYTAAFDDLVTELEENSGVDVDVGVSSCGTMTIGGSGISTLTGGAAAGVVSGFLGMLERALEQLYRPADALDQRIGHP